MALLLSDWGRRCRPHGRWLGLLCLACCLALPARADVWGFVDEKGIAHFASERVDDRYELFFRNAESFDTSLDAAMPQPAHDPVLLPAAPNKLLDFFQVSPTFKLVRQHLRDASSDHNIDFELLQALIAAESGFNTSAVSPKGAIGLMQLMPATARRYGVEGDMRIALEQKLADPKINIKTGTRYLRDLINMFPGRLDLALASYNAGEGAVQRAGNNIPNYKETQNYVKTVMQLYNGLKPPAAVVEQRFPTRIRMEMLGGAARRGNMLAPLPPPAGPGASQGAFSNTVPGSSLATNPIPLKAD